MLPDRWKQIGDLYYETSLLPEGEQSSFLEKACGGDWELRREVESLLASSEKAKTFLDSYPGDVVAGMIVAEDIARSMSGQKLGRYQLHSLIGSGGMGEVYRASDTRLEREVAVKILPAHLSTDREALNRFEREAKAVAALSHPNILAIYDFGSEQELSFAVMELLQGQTLREQLQPGPVGWKRTAEIGIAICEGLSAAHARGIIHRDLKPENIFLTTNGQVKILDFGIARLKSTIAVDTEDESDTASETTNPSGVMGTIGYMSPEQVRGDIADAPSDIFSLGCVLYEMASGARPFEGETRSGTVKAILNVEPPSISETGERVPDKFDQVVRRCLEKNCADRYQTAQEVSVDLKTLVTVSNNALASDQLRTFRLSAWLAGLTLLSVALTLGYWWKSKQTSPAEAALKFKSIAVLPFKPLTLASNNEQLGLGLADTVITKLSGVKSLIVRPTSAIMKYGSSTEDPLAAGREQQVDAVVDGSFQENGERIRISLRLLNVRDETTLWSYQCDELLCNNFFAMQDVIAERVAATLMPLLSGAERSTLRKHYTENKAAYQDYVNGVYFWNKRTQEGFRKGIEYFEEAIKKDPDYALAYVGLANSYNGLGSWAWAPPRECFPKARLAVLKALQLDPKLAEAHAAFAQYLRLFEWKWAEAEKEFKVAFALNPGYAEAHLWYGIDLGLTARFDEAKDEMRQALAMDPLSHDKNFVYAKIFYWSRDPDQEIPIYKEIIERDPNWFPAHLGLAYAYASKGMEDAAFASFVTQYRTAYPGAKWLDELLEGFQKAYAESGLDGYYKKRLSNLKVAWKDRIDKPNFPFAMQSLYAGENEEGLNWLERACDDHDPQMCALKVDRLFDPVRSNPRFIKLEQRVGLIP